MVASSTESLPPIDFEDERCQQAFERLLATHARNDERWRFVVTPSFTTRDYLVSDHGRILSLPRYRHYAPDRRTGVAHRKFLPGGLRKPGRQSGGFRSITFTHRKRPYRAYVHQLVAWAFLGPQPAGAHIKHRDGNAANNHLANLYYYDPRTLHDLVANEKAIKTISLPIPDDYLRLLDMARTDDSLARKIVIDLHNYITRL